MSTFTRRALLMFTAKFLPLAGETGTPSAAEVKMSYKDLSGSERQETIPLTLDTDGETWTCDWDTTNAGAGRVDWAARCWGGLQAAVQGHFNVAANTANRS